MIQIETLFLLVGELNPFTSVGMIDMLILNSVTIFYNSIYFLIAIFLFLQGVCSLIFKFNLGKIVFLF